MPCLELIGNYQELIAYSPKISFCTLLGKHTSLAPNEKKLQIVAFS